MKRLDGKVALVTGGGIRASALGIAETFAREGAQVALDRYRPGSRRARGRRHW